jgi:hypothetical protein
MKKRFLIIAALIGLLVSCRDPGGDPPDVIDPNQKTTIVFDNTQGICAVTVYSSYPRNEENKITQISAGRLSQEFEYYPGSSVPFFLSYQINFKGISGFTVDFVPPENAKNQIYVRVDPNIKTTIPIPPLAEALASPDTLLSRDSYLLIQNNSSYPIELLRNSSIIKPDNISETVVNSGERAQYTINAGAASNYRLLIGADYVTFPGSLVSFEAGRVYSFTYSNGVLSLTSEVELKLENAAGVSPDMPVPQAPGAPVITASDRLLTVRWTAVEDAESYEVYISTAQNPPALPERTVYSSTTVLTGLTNKTTYYVWVKAVNENGASDFSPRARGVPWPANEVPAVPGRPVIIPGINQLTVSWEETGGASSYEVHVSTTSSTPSTSSTPNVTSDKTSAVINNLQNDVIYYIWVRAVNNAGKSGYSPVEAGTPSIPTVAPAAPGIPVLSAGNREIAVSWQAVELASAYEVWFGTSDNSAQAEKFGGDITGGITETIITELVNDQIYYVWIRAKNSTGVSDYGPSASGVPVGRSPGLYRGIEKIGDQNLNEALSYISSNVIHGDDFYIVLGEDESVSPMTLNYSGKTVGITLLGYGDEKTITLNSTGSMFTINAGVTLTIDENITLVGMETNNTYLVSLSGELIINDGAKIINNNGGGISVSSSGTVIMYGGSISGNIASSYGGGIYTNGGTVIMHGGTISNNNSLSDGISISVSSSGAFTMYGGTISGDLTSTGISVSSGNFTMHGGKISDIYGQGIYANGGTVIMHGGTISGIGYIGILVSSGNFTMNGGTISGNRTGILVSSGNFTMNGGTISGNYESGIYVSRDYGSSGTVTMNEGTISGNASNNGGGIYVSSNYGSSGTAVTIYGGTINGNTATNNGGGIYVSGVTVTIYGGTISGNTATNNGGGIYVSGGIVTMHGGTISGNNSDNGGGIFASSTFKKIPSGNGQNSGIIYGYEETGADADGVPLRNTANSGAHAVYSSPWSRNTTAGQTDHIDSTTGMGLSANGNAPFGE